MNAPPCRDPCSPTLSPTVVAKAPVFHFFCDRSPINSRPWRGGRGLASNRNTPLDTKASRRGGAQGRGVAAVADVRSPAERLARLRPRRLRSTSVCVGEVGLIASIRRRPHSRGPRPCRRGRATSQGDLTRPKAEWGRMWERRAPGRAQLIEMVLHRRSVWRTPFPLSGMPRWHPPRHLAHGSHDLANPWQTGADLVADKVSRCATSARGPVLRNALGDYSAFLATCERMGQNSQRNSV